MNILLQTARFLYTYLKHHKALRFQYTSVVGRHAVFEGNNSIGSHTSYTGHMGRCSYIAQGSDLYAKMGRYTSIGSNVKSIMYRHPVSYPFATTSPAFYSTLGQCGGINYATETIFDERIMADSKSDSAIIIGNDCWINSDVRIISGVTIGDGAVVLAGAVVTRDVPPYAIVGGIPAKVIKYRYNEEDIKWLLDTKWWDKPEIWLKDNWRLFANIIELKQALNP